jgi:hypothetical protein
VDSPFVLAAALAASHCLRPIEFGLYQIFSMLLSPQLGSGGMVAEGRRIVIGRGLSAAGGRLQLAREDAVNKAGLTLKTRSIG